MSEVIENDSIEGGVNEDTETGEDVASMIKEVRNEQAAAVQGMKNDQALIDWKLRTAEFLIDELQKQIKERENLKPKYDPDPMQDIGMADATPSEGVEDNSEYQNTAFLEQTDTKASDINSTTYPPQLRTITKRTLAHHKHAITLYGAEAAWANKTKIPTLPKDASNNGDLTWVEVSTVTVITDIQFDVSTGYIQVKTRDITVPAGAESGWTNKIQVFECDA